MNKKVRKAIIPAAGLVQTVINMQWKIILIKTMN